MDTFVDDTFHGENQTGVAHRKKTWNLKIWKFLKKANHQPLERKPQNISIHPNSERWGTFFLSPGLLLWHCGIVWHCGLFTHIQAPSMTQGCTHIFWSLFDILSYFLFIAIFGFGHFNRVSSFWVILPLFAMLGHFWPILTIFHPFLTTFCFLNFCLLLPIFEHFLVFFSPFFR